MPANPPAEGSQPAALRASFIASVRSGLGRLRPGRFMRYRVVGPSMVPALADGDWVIADKRAYRRHEPAAGDIVAARDPRDLARVLVKRVIRAERDGRLWIEGDNPAESTDSRTFGPIAPRLITAKVVFRYWPRPGRVS
jgi:nickel-type superoxide dismutase maturation protease